MKRIAALLLLFLLTFALYAIDPWGRQLTPLLGTAPALLLLAALIDTTVLAAAVLAARGGGWGLAGRLALLTFGVKTAVVAVETVYLPEVLPLAWIPGLLFNGALTAVILAPAAVWLLGRGGAPPPDAPWFPWTAVPWWRWPFIGLLWLLLFVIVGLLVFQPLARALDAPAAEAYLADFSPDNPLLILAFQALRGMLWALLAWPFLNALRGRWPRRGLVLGLLFAGLMGSAQLLGIDFLPPRIWPAHLLEVVVENFLFGLVVAWGLRPRGGFIA